MFDIFNSSQFMAHGMCLLWRADLISLHVISDGLTALAYFSIPVTLFIVVRRRPHLNHRRLVALFAAFVLLCGLTHLASIWTLWYPDYAAQGLLKAATAIVSLMTAALLWPALPVFLAAPGPSELAELNSRLQAEVAQRQSDEQHYRKLAADREEQIAYRTRRLEKALQERTESEYRFQGAFDHARSGKAICGLDGEWLRVNPALCQMLGYSEKELLEAGWRAVTHPDDVTQTHSNAAMIIDGEIDSFTLPKRYLTRDGKTIHAVADVCRVFNHDGDPVFFVTEIQDLTRTVGLEAAFLQSEARAATIIETATDAIFELDAAGHILSCNPAATRMLRVGIDELIGCPLDSLISRSDGNPDSWQHLLDAGITAPHRGADDMPLFSARAGDTSVPVEVRVWHSEFKGGVLYSAIICDISERVAAERSLREAHEELRFHMANSPLGVIKWDPQFNVTYWSPAAERIFGWSGEFALGRNPGNWRIVHEEDQIENSAAMTELSSGRTERCRIVNRNYRSDGSVIQCEWFNSVRIDADGRVESVLSFVEDITERVEAVSAMMRSEAHTKAILDTAVDCIISIDPRGTVLSCNPATESIFGYQPDEVIGRNVKMLMPAHYRREHDSYLSNYMETGKRAVIGIGREVVGLRKNGEAFPMELSVSEIHTEGQHTFTGFVRDISERKRFEKEIIEGNLLLQHQDWLLSGHAALSKTLQGEPTTAEVGRRALDFFCSYLGAQVGVFFVLSPARKLRAVATYGHGVELDVHGDGEVYSSLALQASQRGERVVLDVSGAHAALNLKSAFGEFALREVIAFPVMRENAVEGVLELATINSLHPRYHDLLEFIDEALAVALESARNREQLTNVLEASQQQTLELEARSRELHLLNNDLIDRSRALENKNLELEAAKREIEQKARAIEQANRYKSEFLANMSHELRTPLNSMLVLSRTLADNVLNTLNAEDADCARVINKSGENLLALINDILDLSKVEAGKLSLEMSSTRAADIAAQLAEQFEPIARTRNLEFVVNCPEPDVVLITDTMRLQQILRNLLGNAFKFTDRGRVTLSIRNRGESGVEFRVSDTGIGISKQAQKRIFGAFNQVDGTTRRRYEGTGLGLSISNELARLLNAELKVESTPGSGCEFIVIVPRVHPHADATSAIIEAQRTAAAPGTGTAPHPDHTLATLSGFSVLVVEPDYRQSFALSRVLSEHGVEVSIADTCSLASDMLTARQFDAILLDSSMHEKLGENLIRAATRRTTGDGLPIIMLASDRLVGAAARADNRICLSKPVAAASLLQALEDLLVVAA